ncbi:hypothetical protein NECAME_01699 [Necator americanus]|uniref:CDP-alcohol phosphatidyltransferase n=1 Tax=Necator americanus TaxID=51031 RepID=W2TS12_NECAM|nr:hypothetical protein NECAME_01699 [Necator americanus]ETN83906.1 hypothetical protein NECAME_01699 [Necator americanus]
MRLFALVKGEELPVGKSDVTNVATCTEMKKATPSAVTVTEGRTIQIFLGSGFVARKRRKILMGLFETKYLSASQLKGFDSYKYSCVDTSPISKYISHPFWNWLVTFYPRTWAPNVLTLLGWSLVMACFLVESVLDYDLTANSVGSEQPIPDWFWMFAAICTWLGYTLDGTDGKQARRIGASGPTGELCVFLLQILKSRFVFMLILSVDHGLDSWSTVPFTITIFSVFGRGEYSVSPIHLLSVLISVQIVFIVTHWEKYNTGILFLSWGYDASQYTLVFVYLFTYFVGYKWYKFYVFGEVTLAVVFEATFYFCCVGSLIMSAYNMWYSYAVENTFKQLNAFQPSIYEASRPIIPSFILFAISLAWAVYSPTDVCGKDPRIFFFAMGTVFSNIACRLIIAQMSNHRCEVMNLLLAVYASSAGFSFFMPSMELIILRLMCLLVVVAHVHYGVCVVSPAIVRSFQNPCSGCFLLAKTTITKVTL